MVVRSIILLCLASGFAGAQESIRNKANVYVPPPENILLLVATQPDCPLLIEQPRLLLDVNNPKENPRFEYSLRSVSKKPIRSYAIAAWWSNQTGGTLGHGKPLLRHIQPGAVVQVRGADYRLVTLSDELKKNLGQRLQALVVLMVYQIKFDDGTEYNGDLLSDSMLQYFEDHFN